MSMQAREEADIARLLAAASDLRSRAADSQAQAESIELNIKFSSWQDKVLLAVPVLLVIGAAAFLYTSHTRKHRVIMAKLRQTPDVIRGVLAVWCRWLLMLILLSQADVMAQPLPNDGKRAGNKTIYPGGSFIEELPDDDPQPDLDRLDGAA
jgi:hypothetical protein